MRFFSIALALCIVGCVAPEEPSGPRVGMTHTTSAEARHWELGLTPNLRIGTKLMRTCALRFGEDVQGAPYWFDPVGLSAVDEDILLQLAHCVSVGPLKGRALRLAAEDVGDAGLTTERAERARRYLVDHGLPPIQVATGSDADAGAAIPRDGRIEVRVGSAAAVQTTPQPFSSSGK